MLFEVNGSEWLRFTIEGNNLARRMVEEAIAMCPEDPQVYIDLGWIYYRDYVLGNTKPPRETLEKAIELAQKAPAVNDSRANAHALLSHCYSRKEECKKAIAEGERAVSIDPERISALIAYANGLSDAGRPEEAIPIFPKGIRLSPFGISYLYGNFGWARLKIGRFEEAVSAYKKALHLSPHNIFPHLGLAVTYIQTAREKEARAEVEEILRLNPKFSLDSFAKALSYKDQSVADNFVDALRKAGLK